MYKELFDLISFSADTLLKGGEYLYIVFNGLAKILNNYFQAVKEYAVYAWSFTAFFICITVKFLDAACFQKNIFIYNEILSGRENFIPVLNVMADYKVFFDVMICFFLLLGDRVATYLLKNHGGNNGK